MLNAYRGLPNDRSAVAPEQVRAEVREIKQAFAGSPRLIVGTGDQVGRETPEENLRAMIAEAQRI
jgi:hypothetical protein